jgi:hypothetical protein
MLLTILILATLVVTYFCWIRPVLRTRPELKHFYDTEENQLIAIQKKFQGIKQKLSSGIVIAASVAVSAYDFLAPIVNGVDAAEITNYVPRWAWPLILIATTALFQFLRNLSDKRNETSDEPERLEKTEASA